MTTTIEFNTKDLSRVIDEMIAKKNQLCPELNDDNVASVNRSLIETVAIQVAWMIQQQNVIANQAYIKTTTMYDTLKNLCELLAYDIPTAIAATGTLNVSFRDSVLSETIVLDQWTEFATPGTSTEERIIFETSEEVTKMPGIKTVSVPIVQGERTAYETLGSSNGSEFQEFTLENSPVLIDDTLEIHIVDWIGPGAIPIPPPTTKWTKVDSLMAYDSDDEVYEIDYDEDTAVTIKFGDNNYGKIPPIGTNNILAHYRTGGGDIGNVAADKITVMVSSTSDFESCTNPTATSGGVDKQSDVYTRMLAPRSIKYSDRVVATEDFGIRAMEYPGVARATQHPREFGENTVGIRIVPTGGGYPADDLCTEVEHFVLYRSTTTLDVYVHSVKYREIDITAEIKIAYTASEAEVLTAIEAVLDNYFDPTYINSDGDFEVGFGEKIYLAKLAQIIMNAHSDIVTLGFSAPTTDTELYAYELPLLDTLTLTFIREAAED